MTTHNHAPTITLFAKPGCHLCDDAREILEDLLAQPSFRGVVAIDEIDIRLDPVHFERYRYRIPVIMLDDTIIAEGRIDAASSIEISAILNDTIGKRIQA